MGSEWPAILDSHAVLMVKKLLKPFQENMPTPIKKGKHFSLKQQQKKHCHKIMLEPST